MSNKLPIRALPTATVDIDGTAVEVRGLSRSEAMHFTTAFTPGEMPDVSLDDRAGRAEVYLLMKGVGVDEDEAIAWREQTEVDVSDLVIDKILELSGLTQKADGKDPQAPTSEPSSEASSTPSTSPSRKLSVA